MGKIQSVIDRAKRRLGYAVELRPQIAITEDIVKKRVRHIASKAGGLGDELMALGVTQAAKRIYPEWNCVFHSRHFTLLNNASGLTDIVKYDLQGNADRIELTYRSKSNYSLNRQMAIQLGIDPPDYRIELPRFPECQVGHTYRSERVTLVIQTDSSGWTPNKEWPRQHWQLLIESVPSDWEVWEVGQTSLFTQSVNHPRFHSYSGQTSLAEYAALVQKADCFVGPPSGGMHLAHAFNVPSVIIVGGYEAAHYPYPLARQLGSDLPCAPCWLRTPCPYDRRCLREITPEQVLAELLTQVGKKLTTDY